MNTVNQELLEYVREQLRRGVPREYVKRVLLENDWSEAVVTEALAQVNNPYSDPRRIPLAGEIVTEHISTVSNDEIYKKDQFAAEKITMDKIIEKFIPIAGTILLVVGFGYLIYANAWVHLSMEIRLTFGFFFSIVLIGSSFSFSEKMRYFADLGIGAGVLLLYGTLIYGSRTTELATAMIPEVVTLITATFFTVAVSYFASRRKSKVILMLGMIGAYITPFVIGQNDVWVSSVSFNAYLIYFLAVNLSVFLIGRELSVRDIIPLNIAGLFIGVSTLWGLAYSDNINVVRSENFLTGEMFTGILFMVLVIFSIWSILLSAQKFNEKDDGYLSLGYIAPVIWFVFNVANLNSLSDIAVGSFYALIAASCFIGWHLFLEGRSKLQHTALYAAGLISTFLAVVAFFEEFDVFTSILIAYSSLIFAFLFILDSTKTERFMGYILVSLTGSVLALYHILEANIDYETLLIVLALLPAISARLIAQNGRQAELIPPATAYSIIWSAVASMFVLSEFIDYLDSEFLFFYLLPLIFLGYLVYLNQVAPDKISHNSRSVMLRTILIWFALSFATVFFTLVDKIYPAPTKVFLFTNTDLPTDWLMVKGVFGTLILFTGLWISRKLQLEQVIKRPSFILVIFGFSSLLLTGNYIISAIANDLDISVVEAGPRAVATTLWWSAIAIFMLYKGIKLGKKYHSEKLLGLLLLGITLVKVILYDMHLLSMQNKIIILMLVGGAMLLFSYVIRSKNLLQSQPTQQ